VDPVPDTLLLIKSDSARNRTRDLWVSSQELWALTTEAVTRERRLFYYVSSYSSSLLLPSNEQVVTVSALTSLQTSPNAFLASYSLPGLLQSSATQQSRKQAGITLTLLIFIREALGSNLIRSTDCSYWSTFLPATSGLHGANSS
jgi:hypothetical protein